MSSGGPRSSVKPLMSSRELVNCADLPYFFSYLYALLSLEKDVNCHLPDAFVVYSYVLSYFHPGMRE